MQNLTIGTVISVIETSAEEAASIAFGLVIFTWFATFGNLF